jgi:acyl dehydratase
MDRIEITRTLKQAEFDAFAKLSGDDNPIHVDPDFSARTRFGRTVAHGVFLQTILRGLCDQLRPGARQLSQALSFTAPTYAEEEMKFTAEVTGENNGETSLHCEVSRVADGTSTCQMDIVLKGAAS